jgi:heat shock protein HslJ
MKTTTAWLAALALGSLLGACSSPSPDAQTIVTTAPATTEETAAAVDTAASTSAVPPALVGRWTLVAIDGAPVAEVGRVPTLEIAADGSAGGVGGVNRFRTQLEAANGRIAVGETAATKMAGPPAAMELEAAFLGRLGSISGFEAVGDTLRLLAGDAEALRFTRSKE